MTPVLFCLATSRGIADCILHELKQAAFLPAEISVLFLEHAPYGTVPGGRQLTVLGAAAPSAGQVRGVLAWVADVGRIECGREAWIAGGPAWHALQHDRDPATPVSPARLLQGFGLPVADAERYEDRLRRDHHLLIAVHVLEPADLARARSIFTATRGGDIRATVAAAPEFRAATG